MGLKTLLLVAGLSCATSSLFANPERTYPTPPSIDLSRLIGISNGKYQLGERTYDMKELRFDTNRDGYEDAKFTFLTSPYENWPGAVSTLLIEWGIDWNKNLIALEGEYEHGEITKLTLSEAMDLQNQQDNN